MAKRGKHLSVEEKIGWLEMYQDSGESVCEFFEKHDLGKSTFYKILNEYGGQPVEQTMSEAEHIQREKELQMEILKLKIENERLKKTILSGQRRMGRRNTYV